MPSLKVIAICGILMVTPIMVVLFANAEQLIDSYHIEGSESQGKVLYFTAPSR